jgi:hypothetical protein
MESGVTAIDDSVGATTVKFITGLLIPERFAAISVLPIATLVTKPNIETVAILGSELVHVTLEEMSAVDPSA